MHSGVLIETLWNVKDLTPYFFYVHPRINRNIVECKDFQSSNTSRQIQVLIETLWNVKDEVFAVKSRKILY